MVKNKLAPPFKQVITEILYGEGISREGELIDMGVDAKLVEKAGAWYSYGEERIGQGRTTPAATAPNPTVAVKLRAELREVPSRPKRPAKMVTTKATTGKACWGQGGAVSDVALSAGSIAHGWAGCHGWRHPWSTHVRRRRHLTGLKRRPRSRPAAGAGPSGPPRTLAQGTHPQADRPWH